MKFKLFILCCLTISALCLAFCLAACQGEPDGSDRETFPKESYATVLGTDLSHRGGLSRDGHTSDSAVGEWLTACASSDRDEQFDAYTLRTETSAGENTTFTYMIYYPHGTSGMTAEVELLEGESGGYILNVTYTSGGSDRDYCLDLVTVTLPTDKAPRVRLICGDEVLGQLATVTDREI